MDLRIAPCWMRLRTHLIASAPIHKSALPLSGGGESKKPCLSQWPCSSYEFSQGQRASFAAIIVIYTRICACSSSMGNVPVMTTSREPTIGVNNFQGLRRKAERKSFLVRKNVERAADKLPLDASEMTRRLQIPTLQKRAAKRFDERATQSVDVVKYRQIPGSQGSPRWYSQWEAVTMKQ